jgi:hypothetical protein
MFSHMSMLEMGHQSLKSGHNYYLGLIGRKARLIFLPQLLFDSYKSALGE